MEVYNVLQAWQMIFNASLLIATEFQNHYLRKFFNFSSYEFFSYLIAVRCNDSTFRVYFCHFFFFEEIFVFFFVESLLTGFTVMLSTQTAFRHIINGIFAIRLQWFMQWICFFLKMNEKQLELIIGLFFIWIENNCINVMLFNINIHEQMSDSN